MKIAFKQEKVQDRFFSFFFCFSGLKTTKRKTRVGNREKRERERERERGVEVKSEKEAAKTEDLMSVERIAQYPTLVS